jgi:hypothetical protein
MKTGKTVRELVSIPTSGVTVNSDLVRVKSTGLSVAAAPGPRGSDLRSSGVASATAAAFARSADVVTADAAVVAESHMCALAVNANGAPDASTSSVPPPTEDFNVTSPPTTYRIFCSSALRAAVAVLTSSE